VGKSTGKEGDKMGRRIREGGKKDGGKRRGKGVEEFTARSYA